MKAQEPAPLADVRRILFLRPNAVGDFVFALPALHALKRGFAQAELIYIGQPWHAEFLRERPGPVDRVLVLPPCPGIGAPPQASLVEGPVRSFVQEVRALRADLAVQAYGGGRYSNPLVRALGARLAIGLRAPGAASLDRSIALRPLQNRRLQLLEVVALAGGHTSFELAPELQVVQRDRDEAAAAVPVGDSPLVVVQPGASDARRRWPAKQFGAVADALVRYGAQVAVNGTGHEAALVREVIDSMSLPAANLAGKLSLGGLCGLLERAALVVSNDTGPLHLALAIGTPAVGIYWLTNLLESQPLRQSFHRAAVAARTTCPVCGAENLTERCAHDESFVADVRTDDVLQMAVELLVEKRAVD